MSNQILITTPVMTIELFAERAGVSPASARSMVHSNFLPTIKKGKRRFINMVALTNECLQQAEAHPISTTDSE